MNSTLYNSIDTDRGFATIMSKFDSQYIVDVIGDCLKMRFRPFNVPSPNYVEILERQFQEVLYMSPDYAERVNQCRQDTYIEVITIICNYYNLVYSEEIKSMNVDELHGLAYHLYDIFVSRFTFHLVDFFTSYIVRNVDSITDMLNNNPNTIRIKDNTMYQSKQFVDPKWILIHQNVNNIVYNMCSLDIPFEDMVRYFTDPNIAERIIDLITDAGDIYKNHYACYIFDQTTAAALYTEVKLNLQRKTQEQVYIGEF